MVKKVSIQIVLDGKNIATKISKDGFDDTLSSQLELIGILNNLVAQQQDKLKVLFNKSK